MLCKQPLLLSPSFKNEAFLKDELGHIATAFLHVDTFYLANPVTADPDWSGRHPAPPLLPHTEQEAWETLCADPRKLSVIPLTHRSQKVGRVCYWTQGHGLWREKGKERPSLFLGTWNFFTQCTLSQYRFLANCVHIKERSAERKSTRPALTVMDVCFSSWFDLVL